MKVKVRERKDAEEGRSRFKGSAAVSASCSSAMLRVGFFWRVSLVSRP